MPFLSFLKIVLVDNKKFTNIFNLVIYEAHVYKTNIYFVLKCNIKLAVIPDLLPSLGIQNN